MSLPNHVLTWPPTVARQVHAALFMPAADMHPERWAQTVPPALQGLAPEVLSRAMDHDQRTDPASAFDGRQLSHRLALLPRAVIERLCQNLGLLSHAGLLRKVVLREDLSALAQAGMDEAAWTLVFATPPAAQMDAPAALATAELARWPALLCERGEQALLALAETLPGPLAQRLRWKLPPHPSQGGLPPPAMLQKAYAASLQDWCAEWDTCLSQATPAH